MTDITLTVFSNEDLYRDFVLREGTSEEDAVATDLTGMSLACEIRDSKDVLVLRMDSDEDTTLTVLDAATGSFGFRIDRDLLPDTGTFKFDVLLTEGIFTRRIFGGKIKIKSGVTQDI